MRRLFVLGDSWAFNYFSKDVKHRPDQQPNLSSYEVLQFVRDFDFYGHWCDLIGDYFDVHNFSEHGCSNEDIVHQLGFIPEYIEGDRIVIIFTNPARYQWIVNNKKIALTLGSPWQTFMSSTEKEIVNNQLILRDDLWFNTKQRNNEKLFINKIPTIFKDFNPIMLTWYELLGDTVENIKNIPLNEKYTSINYESGNKYNDYHLGLNGNFELFTFIMNELGEEINDNKTYRKNEKRIL